MTLPQKSLESFLKNCKSCPKQIYIYANPDNILSYHFCCKSTVIGASLKIAIMVLSIREQMNIGVDLF